MSALVVQGLPAAPLRLAGKGGPAAPGTAEPTFGLGRDMATFSTPTQPPPQAAATAPVRTQGLPGWVGLAGFVGIWGIWGFPAALLGAIGFWAAGKMVDAVSR